MGRNPLWLKDDRSDARIEDLQHKAFTHQQEVVYEWLISNGLSSYAEVYRGALQLLNEKPPGYVTFVAHAGREIMNGLVPDISGEKRPQVQYVQLVETLATLWKEDWRNCGLPSGTGPGNGHLIPWDICRKVTHLINEHEAGRERSDKSSYRFFTDLLAYDNHQQIHENLPLEWRRTKDGFLSMAHLRAGDLPDGAEYKIVSLVETLDRLLHMAATSEVGRLKRVNEILEEANG